MAKILYEVKKNMNTASKTYGSGTDGLRPSRR